MALVTNTIYPASYGSLLNVDASWSNTRGVGPADAGTAVTPQQYAVMAGQAGGNHNLYRTFLRYDISSLNTAAYDVPHTTAILKVWGDTNSTSDVILVKGSQGTSVTVADWTNLDHSTPYSGVVGPSSGGWVIGGWNTFTLNAAALSDLWKKNDFYVVMIDHVYDYSDLASPASPVASGAKLNTAILVVTSTAWLQNDSGAPQFGAHDPDFTSNKYKKLSREHIRDVGQVPFSKGIKGPASLRGRNTPYTVTKG
jgi:hypothetical protein